MAYLYEEETSVEELKIHIESLQKIDNIWELFHRIKSGDRECSKPGHNPFGF